MTRRRPGSNSSHQLLTRLLKFAEHRVKGPGDIAMLAWAGILCRNSTYMFPCFRYPTGALEHEDLLEPGSRRIMCRAHEPAGSLQRGGAFAIVHQNISHRTPLSADRQVPIEHIRCGNVDRAAVTAVERAAKAEN
jgi:hypothetical protein